MHRLTRPHVYRPQIHVNHTTGSTEEDIFDSDEEGNYSADEVHHRRADESHGLDDYDDDEEDEDEDDGSWVKQFDEIDPEESASRSQEPLPAGRSRARYPVAREPPRRNASHIRPAVVEPPAGPPPRQRTRSSRDRQPRPRSIAELEDDYPGYGGGRNGHQMPYHPAAQWANVGLYPGQAHTVVSRCVRFELPFWTLTDIF